MENLLSYSKYERVLCIAFDEHGQLLLQESSNRVVQMVELDYLDDYNLDDKSFQSLLKEYLDACCAKEQEQQSRKEKHTILTAQKLTWQLRQELLKDRRIMFDKCQILFILPFGWNCNEYMDQLQTLFMETAWIHQNNPKNRLIFSPFTEGICQGLIANNAYNFEREKKYLLLSLDKTAIHLSSFQMQSAKELIAVSKKLAASDFLLIPTDLGDAVTMDISDLDRLIYNKVKEIIIRHNYISAAAQPPFSAKILHQAIEHIVSGLYQAFTADTNAQLHEILDGLEGSEEILRGLTCGVLMYDLLTDTNTKGFVSEVVCKVKKLHSKYSNLQNSPDGIQDVILHCHSRTNGFYKDLFRKALFDDNLVDALNGFNSRLNICFGAMQKPLKMVQIANALLPPTIWKDGDGKQLEWTDYNTREEDLLPPNSFYIQAYINDDHIRFILNKVIAVSSLDGTVQKSTFTIQETSVELENIFDSVCDTMWNHLMMPECQRHPELFDHCDTHLAGEYSAADYYFFKCSIQDMTDKLLQKDFTKCNQDIDSNHAIAISKECSCSFQISFRTLINIGLQPAIGHIATTITSSLASSSLFGLYTVSALIIMDDSNYVLLQKHHNIFGKTMQRCLQAHHGRTIVFYSRETVMAACESLGSWCAGLQEVFGKGSYSQISSTDYAIGFADTTGMYKYDSNSLRKGDFIERPSEYVILKKGQALDSSGTIHTFYYRDYGYKTIIFSRNCDSKQAICIQD